MKIYQASMFLLVFLEFIRLFPNEKLNILLSYAILGRNVEEFCIKYRDRIGGLILDSGTWTLNNSKSIIPGLINVQCYMDFLKWFRELFDSYFSFDIDHSDKGSEINLANQLIMEKEGLNPVPVVHDINGDEIDFLIDRGYKGVALGSAQIKSPKMLDYVMKKFEGTGIKIHLFGHTKFNLIANFPMDSCDSTAWAHTGSYGHIKYWNPKKDGENKTDQIYLEEYLDEKQPHEKRFSEYEYKDDLENFLNDTFGLTFYDLLSNRGSYNKMLVNTYYLVQLEKAINEIHREKGFNTMTDNEK